MGVMIAGLALGAAGGIMGGIQQGKEAQAQYLAQKVEVERNNFQNNLKNDRQTEMMAKANTNRRLNNEALSRAAWTNQFMATRQLTDNTQESYLQASMSAMSAQSTLHSQITGKLGSASGGTAAALKRQAKAAERRKYSQISEQSREEATRIETDYKNTLAQRDMLTHDQASVYIPGSTGVKPSMAGPIMSGVLGGVSSGLSLGMNMDTFATNLGSK